jgi:hypothetical protein
VGKSTLLARVVAGLPADLAVAVIDPAGSPAWGAWPARERAPERFGPGVYRLVPPASADNGSVAKAAAAALRAAYRQGNVLVVADEVADWPWLEAVVRRGRQRGAAVWWATQYATGAPRYLLSQTDAIWSGVQVRGVDVRVLEDATGADWSVLPRLPPFRWAVWEGGDVYLWGENNGR